MGTIVLDTKRVEEIFRDCLLKDGEDADKGIGVDSIIRDVQFHLERLEVYRVEIETFLSELPDAFQESGGGGASFLAACKDKHDNLWTGCHLCMGQLFSLGLGIGKVKHTMPREMWGHSSWRGAILHYNKLKLSTSIKATRVPDSDARPLGTASFL